jgi:two-component system sensor histidine kinase
LLQVPAAVEFIECTLSEDMIIETDVMRLRQVLMNFVSNAFKFTVSGHVAIGVEHNDVRKEVCFYVEDTGAGIPEAEQKMIFDRFYKINEFTQGTGLGLSICQVIATKLKGRITLSSEMNKGSRFNIVLSYADQAGADHLHPDNALTVAEKVSSVNSNLPIVLIAEDSVNNYMVLNNILKKFCTVVWAINGKDALDIVNKQKVDVVLMDIKMYEMDGLTALRKIRKKNKKLPVVIQTAYAFDENRKQAEEAGANGFIAKPIRVEELMGVIGKYIGN